MDPQFQGTDDHPQKNMPEDDTPATEINASTSDPTDGREPYEWQSRYDPQAKKEIRLECAFLVVLLGFAILLLFSTWIGWWEQLLGLSDDRASTFRKYLYFASAGLLGGVAYGMKFFYRVVARGYWHQDRRMWRILSPVLSGTVAFIIGAMVEASLITVDLNIEAASLVSIGFLGGYFADRAVGKMYEVASVIFGKSTDEHK